MLKLEIWPSSFCAVDERIQFWSDLPNPALRDYFPISSFKP